MANDDFFATLWEELEVADQTNQIELDRLKADGMLRAVGKIESQMADVNELCDSEIKLIEEYRSRELARLDKKRSWLVFNLEHFMRSSGEKTTRLPGGILKIRKGRDRVAVVAMEKFLSVAETLNLLRVIPESATPDNQAILNYIKTTGEIPDGVEYIPADTRFSYTTNGGTEDERE